MRHLVLNLISHYFLTRLFDFQRPSSLAITKKKAHLSPPTLPKNWYAIQATLRKEQPKIKVSF